jgi:hypothetical protein
MWEKWTGKMKMKKVKNNLFDVKFPSNNKTLSNL